MNGCCNPCISLSTLLFTQTPTLLQLSADPSEEDLTVVMVPYLL